MLIMYLNLLGLGSLKEAKNIARTVVKEKLAACVNIIKPIESYYTWKGRLVEDKEILLVIKTKFRLFSRLAELLKILPEKYINEINKIILSLEEKLTEDKE